MLQDKSIDAVCISTPDHWHAQPAIEAALAGKDIYLQKPASLTVREGRQMADAVKHTGRIFQQGSQQRSEAQFRLACELVRNGRIGKVREVYIGLPTDPSGGNTKEMPVPSNLNYDMWLGSTPMVYYTEDRVHPQTAAMRSRYNRPGLAALRAVRRRHDHRLGRSPCRYRPLGHGNRTHRPGRSRSQAAFPKSGLWDVHGPYHVPPVTPMAPPCTSATSTPTESNSSARTAWIWVSRSQTKLGHNDPHTGRSVLKAIDASDPKLLEYEPKAGDVHLHRSPKNDHHLDWLTSIQTRQEPAAPAEVGHRSCSACLVSQIAMKLGRKLAFDPAKERFTNDDEANAMLSRPQRKEYSTDAVMKEHGMA